MKGMNKHIIFLLIIVGWCACPFFGVQAQTTYVGWCERAAAAIEGDSLTQAQEYIRQALRLEPSNPNNALLFSNLGTIQRRQGQYELALESYQLALNLSPMSVPILMNHATLSLELGRYDAARADYSQVIELEPHHEEALLMRAYIYMQQRVYKFARQDYDTLLYYAPLSYNGRLGLATLYQREQHYEDALKVLSGMLVDRGGENAYTDSDLALVYIARAGVELDMRHDDLALVDLNEAIRLDTGQAEAYMMRGQVYLMQDKKTQAKRDFEKAVSLGVPQSEARKWLMRCK